MKPFSGWCADDPAGFLAPVLQGMQPEGYEICRIGQADDAEYAAFLVKFIIVEGMGGGHLFGQEGQLRIRLLAI